MQKYTAIILASRETNEFDRIYIFYAKEAGLVKAIGRGVRKPAARLAGHLEPGTLSELYVARSRGLGQITGAAALENFEKIKKDFEKLAEALEIFKFFTRHFSEGEKDERIFKLLKDFLEFLETSESSTLGVEAFWWKLFELMGQRPQVVKCAACGKSLELIEKKTFDVKKGGALCNACRKDRAESFSISSNQIKLLRLFFSQPFRALGKIKFDPRELSTLALIRKKYLKYNFF